MIPSLILLWLIMGILFLIGAFSPRIKKLAKRMQVFISDKLIFLLSLLPTYSKNILAKIIICLWLTLWILKQRFLG